MAAAGEVERIGRGRYALPNLSGEAGKIAPIDGQAPDDKAQNRDLSNLSAVFDMRAAIEGGDGAIAPLLHLQCAERAAVRLGWRRMTVPQPRRPQPMNISRQVRPDQGRRQQGRARPSRDRPDHVASPIRRALAYHLRTR
jgi:hypothetical protein